jgi:hypothetical protein
MIGTSNLHLLYQLSLPPRFEHVKVYFAQKGISDREAEDFFLFYENRHWMSRKGKVFKNWKNIAYKWIATIWKQDPLSFDKNFK